VGDIARLTGGEIPLVEHFDGTSWAIVDVPVPQARASWLNGVAATGSNDVWAVGDKEGAGGGLRTLIEHWDGLSWSIVQSQDPGVVTNQLVSVSASSATDAWTVGTSDYRTFAEHWDGTSWTVVPTPDPGSGPDGLNDVTAISMGDAWAVSSLDIGGGSSPLAEHWNGSDWEVVSTPTTGLEGLSGVDAIAPDDVFAVGSFGMYPKLHSLSERWDGSLWTRVPTPSRRAAGPLGDVAMASSTSGWAVGFEESARTGNRRPVVELWTGSAWILVKTPHPGTSSQLDGVAVSGANAWAVGSASPPQDGVNTLIEAYC